MPMTLFNYMEDTQRFIADAKQELVDPGDLIRWINRARREVAMRAQCIRILTPISGAVIGANVTVGGSGYTNPIVTISPPDFPSGTLPFPNGAQATGTATQIGGVIVAVNIDYGGAGYFEPIITISDPTGSGAEVTPALSYINQLNQGQEEYPFSMVDLSPFPGVGAIYMIKSVSLIYANYRYSLPCYSFSVYQARIRQYPFQYQYIPTVCAQRGQGTSGTFMLYPLPSSQYQMEWDAFALPQDLLTDQSVEALPEPWTDAVAYFAAHLAYLQIQNFNAAAGYLKLFDQFLNRYSVAARPGRQTNPYGKWILLATSIGCSTAALLNGLIA